MKKSMVTVPSFFTWFDIILMYQYTMFRRAGV